MPTQTGYYRLSLGASYLVLEGTLPAQLPPAAPSGLSATALSVGSIGLAWDAPAGAVSYAVSRSPDGSSWADVAAPSAAAYTDAGLSAGTTYYYRVAAVNANGASPWSTTASAATQPAPVGGPQVLPTYLAAAAAKAAANTAQWQAFKANLDANLPKLWGYASTNGYEAMDVCAPAAAYALGYRCLRGADQATAHNYADRAIAYLRSAVGDYLSGWSTSIDGAFLTVIGVGDGSNAVFTIPDADFIPGSLVVRNTPLTTLALTKGPPGGQDSVRNLLFGGVKYNNGRVVNVTDSPGDTWRTPTTYAFGGDLRWWDHSYDDQYASLAAGGQKPAVQLDWSGAANQPATGATYYVRMHEFQRSLGQASPANYTRSGTTLTFVSPPADGTAVLAGYVYGTRAGDYSALAYQHTHAGDGGFWSISTDSGYNARFLFQVGLALDWLWDYPGLPAALKTRTLDLMVRWADHLRDNGYGRGSVASNYGIACLVARAAFAAALAGRHASASRVASDVQSFWASQAVPMMSAPPFSTHPDPNTPPVGDPAGTNFAVGTYATLKGGWWAEGPEYAADSVENLALAALILGDSGLADVTAAKALADELVTCLAHARTSALVQFAFGDADAYPMKTWTNGTYRSGQKAEALQALAAACSDPQAAAVAAHMTQTGTAVPTKSWQDLMLRDPAAVASDPAGVLPTAYRAGAVLARADWSYASTAVGVLASAPLACDHQWVAAGHLVIHRGGSVLLADGPAVFGYGIAPYWGRSQYCNLVSLDDGGDGLLTYPWAMGPDGGPDAVVVNAYENAPDYAYVSLDTHRMWAKVGSNQAANACVEQTREVLFCRPDYVVLYDRTATTAGKLYRKELRSHTVAAGAVTGDSWAYTPASAPALFASHYAGVPLALTQSTVSISTHSVNRFAVAPSTPADRFAVATVYQSAPAGTASPDASARVASGDGRLEGVQAGQVVALFGTASNAAVATPVSYDFTAPAGTTTHHVCNLTPGQTYTLSGAVQATAAATAAGVLTFTTTGAGPATVTIT